MALAVQSATLAETMDLRRPLTFAACFVFASSINAGPSRDINPARLKMARSLTDQGDVFLRRGDYERAEEAFVHATEQEPRYAAAYLGLGATLVATQRFEAAITVLQEAERRFAEWQQMHQVAGLVDRQHNADRSREIRDFAAQLRQRTPASAGPTVEQNLRREIDTADRGRFVADRLRPDLVDGIPAQVFYLEGLALLRIGRAADGIEALRTALLLDSKHALSHYNLAVALYVRGELEPAKLHLDTAVDEGAQPHPQFVADLNQALDAALN